MRIAAVFLLFVGCLWAFFVVWAFLVIAGIADAPRSLLTPVLYWTGMLIGPSVLITGSALSLRRHSSRTGSILTILGCLVFSGFAIYSSVAGMHREPLQAPIPYGFFAALLLLMVLSDFAAYKILKATPWKSN
ncbi:MAG: hypothetical protein WCF68_21675 [Terriglobales bacterium]